MTDDTRGVRRRRDTRRRFLRATGVVVLPLSLAGCTGSDATNDNEAGSDATNDNEAGSDATNDNEAGSDETSDNEAGSDEAGEDENTETEVSDEPVDRTGQDSVTVEVGAGSGLQFAPAELRISVGTTVRWVWTGEGGGHNVVEIEGVFASHQNRTVTDEPGYTFEHRFDERGRYEYVCQPHSKQGMVGSVDVVE